MDFSSRTNNDAFVTSTDSFLSVGSPFVGSAYKAYMEHQGIIQSSSSTYKEIYKFMWPVGKFKFNFEDINGLKINPVF